VPTQVIYDRAASCAAQMTPAHVNWEHLLDTRLLHLTGITPALSAGCHAHRRPKALIQRRARLASP
jgi:sugar/nucleoside kinase (ribokinase family)